MGTFPVHGAAEVQAAVARARAAAAWWRELGFDERRRRLLAFKRVLARRVDEVAGLIHREQGKPRGDGCLEVLLAGNHLEFAARHARRVLRARRVRGTLVTVTHVQGGRLVYEPYGVVGVIAPWNYPLLIPASDIAAALGAGNTVVLKPSEFSPAVATWLAGVLREVVPEAPVVEVVTGFAETGAALCRAGVDKLTFTGSAATGRSVMAACAEGLVPVTLELGGKDALIVAADADLEAAAEAATFGAFGNAGQSCLSIERVYVVEEVYDAFTERLVRRSSHLRAGPDGPIGPISTPAQFEVVREQLEDALARGARAPGRGREALRRPYVDPVVLCDVPDEARVLVQETFGPLLPLVGVRDVEEALARANASPYALGAAVFSRRRGVELAGRLRAGAVAVNNVQSFYAHPRLPFGGVGRSGFGVVHAEDGLRAFARPRALAPRRFDPGRFSLDRLPRHPAVERLLPGLVRALHRWR